jgi:glycogen debranching enzyme
MKKILPLLLLLTVACGLKDRGTGILSGKLNPEDGITGREEYLNSPYFTPGDRAYMVGHQDGSFPDLGWHVTGEMGGVWTHPIKLMDGFGVNLKREETAFCLDDAISFTNYPFSNEHLFEIDQWGLEVKRRQFVPDGQKGVFIEFELVNTSDVPLDIAFTFNGFIDLRPVWLGERTKMIDGVDQARFDETNQTIHGKDQDNAWHVIYGSSQKTMDHQIDAEHCDYERLGQGVNAALVYDISLKANGTTTIPFVIAGSENSKEEAQNTFDEILKNVDTFYEQRVARYEGIKRTASLQTPNEKLNEAFLWTKYNTDWLINDVEGLGRGITAGNPDYPWFFGADSEYALQGAIAIGMKDIVYSTIQMIDSVSNAVNNGSGKIMHEMSTNGVVFNPGNLNETPQYATLIWEVFKWTGDMDFLNKYYPTVEAGLTWLLEENDADGNLLADGYGMMEIHGLESEMIDVAAYTYKAFIDAAMMAEVLGKEDQSKAYRLNASKLAEIINSDFWADEFDSYADFIGTAKDANHLIDGAIVRADTLDKPWAVEELKATKKQIKSFDPNEKKGFVLYHNWVVNTPMEVGVADQNKAIKALNTGSKYVNPFGVFVTGIDRDESAGTDDGGFAEKMEIFSYTGAVMTLPTGVSAIAENNYGRPDQALAYLERMTKSFSYALPGSMYEVSPDFGMHTQAWNIYSYAVPIIRQFFGIEPMAHLNETSIRPQMPSAWEEAKIDQVQIGRNVLSMSFERTAEGERVIIEQTDPSHVILITASAEVVSAEKAIDRSGYLALLGKRIEVLIK